MLKANDLRIGNLFIEEHSNEIIEVIELSKNAIVFSGNFKGEWQAKPIPLTEEWLLKMGFEKDNSYYLSPNKSSVEGFVDILCFDLENLSFIVDMSEYSGWTVDCKHVHTLQNLYYALCGEELTIKI
jgi:hypothetical protein